MGLTIKKIFFLASFFTLTIIAFDSLDQTDRDWIRCKEENKILNEKKQEEDNFRSFNLLEITKEITNFFSLEEKITKKNKHGILFDTINKTIYFIENSYFITHKITISP